MIRRMSWPQPKPNCYFPSILFDFSIEQQMQLINTIWYTYAYDLFLKTFALLWFWLFFATRMKLSFFQYTSFRRCCLRENLIYNILPFIRPQNSQIIVINCTDIWNAVCYNLPTLNTCVNIFLKRSYIYIHINPLYGAFEHKIQTLKLMLTLSHRNRYYFSTSTI